MTLQFRRGTDSDRLTITPAVGEPIYTTDTKSLYIGDGSTAGGTLVTGSGGVDSASTQAIIDSNIGAIGADLLPAVDSTYDLGSATKKWKDLHLSGNSIFLGGHKIVKDGNTIKFTDSAGATINVTAGNVASSLIDSSDVTAIITAGGYTTYDSTNAAGQITTAINNLVDAAPASLDTLNELAAALNDDANFAATVTGQIAALPDSAQVATIVTSYGYATQTYVDNAVAALPDSAQVATIVTSYGYSTFDSTNATGLIDSAYINARVSATDSATVSAIITADVDAAFINALTIGADSLGGQAPSYYLDYNNFTNTPTIPSAVSDLTNDTGFTTYDSGNFTGQLAAASTSDLSEGTNLYYTTARADSDAKAAISITDAGGDGSLTYSSGVITYTGPSASEVRAHFTAGTGVTISSGQISIAQSVGTTDSVEFGNIDVSGNVVIGGNLQVTGTTTTVNSEDLNVTDHMIYMNAGESAGSPTANIDVGWAANVNDNGSYEHVGMFRDATDDTFKVFHGYTPEPDAGAEINTGHASFALAPFAASTLTGQYQGFDSDVTAAGLATQTYVTNAVAALPDSAQVATIVTSYGYSTFDSTNATGLITSYGYSTYDSSNFTGQLTNSVLRGLIDDSSLTIDGDGSTGGVTIQDGGVEIRTGTSSVAYVDLYCEVNNAHRARIKSAPHASYSGNVDLTLPVTTGTIALTSDIPTALSSLTNDTNYLDSTTVLGVIDATYIQANQTTFLDSALTIQLIDSAYVQARQTAGGGGGTDSATVVSLIGTTVDSAYVQARQSTTGNYAAATAITQYDYEADSAQTTFGGADIDGATLAYTAGKLAVYLNGILLVDSNDYTATNGTNIVLASGADSGDTVSIISYVTETSNLDSAITNIVDSAYIQARQADIYRDSAFVTGIVDSSYVQSRVGTGSVTLAYDANLQGFVDAFTLPTSDGSLNQVLVTNGSGTISFAAQSGGLDSAATIALVDSAYVLARSGGGGGTDSATVNTMIDAKLQVLDVTDLVGADGNPGEYLKTLGNGETEWSDLATQAKQKAFAMTLIFG